MCCVEGLGHGSESEAEDMLLQPGIFPRVSSATSMNVMHRFYDNNSLDFSIDGAYIL